MALIMQAAIQNESFRTIAAATSYTIPATNKAAARNLTSKFTMTDTGSTGFYEGCIGGKEGYTEASGSTLVCAAQRNGMTLISVVLKGASGQTAPDAASILNYGFDQFVTLSLGDSDFSIISGGDVVVPAAPVPIALPQKIPRTATRLTAPTFLTALLWDLQSLKLFSLMILPPSRKVSSTCRLPRITPIITLKFRIL